MPYLVDGHNLIPKIPGLSLVDPEDERALIDLLVEFARQKRTEIEVYFDQAPPARSGTRSFGRVKAHFVRQGTSADQAIMARLRRLGKGARNWTVVSSDRVILAEARETRSEVLSAGEFSALVRGSSSEAGSEGRKGEDPEISQSDIDFWLDQFGRG